MINPIAEPLNNDRKVKSIPKKVIAPENCFICEIKNSMFINNISVRNVYPGNAYLKLK